jgi:SAM-dependent methyltransferase
MNYASDNVRAYFNKVPREWDALYARENRMAYLFNRIFRPGLYKRYAFSFELCGEISGRSVLDIGCGTGRCSIEFAKRGASRVIGIDFAPEMVDFSTRAASQLGVQDRCMFICSDLMQFPVQETFDIVVALGFFDYVKEPTAAFEHVSALTRGVFLASFPGDSLLWGAQRRIRYHWLKRCPIFSYSEAQLSKLFEEAPFPKHRIIAASGGYFGIGQAF